MKNTLTYREAFVAMQNFLEKYYEETNSDDVGSLLGEISFDIWEEESTGDPASWGEWLECVEKVKSDKKTNG